MDPAGEQKKTRPRVGRKKNKRIAGCSAWDPIKFTFGLHSDSVIATEKSEKYTSWSFGEAHEESDPVNGSIIVSARQPTVTRKGEHRVQSSERQLRMEHSHGTECGDPRTDWWAGQPVDQS